MQKFSKDRKVMDSFPEDFLWGGATAATIPCRCWLRPPR